MRARWAPTTRRRNRNRRRRLSPFGVPQTRFLGRHRDLRRPARTGRVQVQPRSAAVRPADGLAGPLAGPA